MNFIDYAIVTIVLLFLVKGLFRGFFSEVFGFLGLIAALIAATTFMSNAAGWIDKLLNVPPAVATIIGFIAIFVLVTLSFHLLASLLQKFTKFVHINWLDKLAGGAVGFLKGGIVASLLTLFVSILPMGSFLVPGQKESLLFEPTKAFAPRIFNLIMKVIPDSKSFSGEIKESLDKISSWDAENSAHHILQSIQSDEDAEKNDERGDRRR